MSEAATAAAKPDLGRLPEWDLKDLYPATDSEALANDLDSGDAEASALAERYEGKMAALSGDGMADLITRFETLSDLLGRIMSFAHLVYARDMNDPDSV